MTRGSTGGNSKAMAVLERWHRLMGVRPQYHYTPGGHSKRASHYYRVTVRIPSAVRQWMENSNGIVVFEKQIVGMGRHHRKSTAQQWAADHAVQHLERLLSLPPATSGSSLSRFLDEWEQQSSSSASATRAPSWKNLPLDPQFAEPGTRRGTIDFGFLLRPTITALDHDVEKTRALRYADAPTSGTTTRSIPSNHAALRAAKVLTLTSRHHLPRTVLHGHAVDGGVLNYVHVRSTSLGYTPHRLAAGCPINLTYPQALQWTLQQIYHHHHNNNDNNENSDDHNYHKKNTNHHHRTKTKPKTRGDPNQEPPHKEPRVSARVWQECVAALGDSSWGMAKLFVQFPPSILEQLKPLLQLWDHQPAQSRLTLDEPSSPRATHSNGNTICSSFSAQQQQLQQQLRQTRIAAFQKHQSLNPLPVDQLKCWPPPFHASSSYVTLVRGGTGSGKTTRLPLRLCLETDHQNRPVRVVVVQPRRLACQSVAERVAYEQGYPLVRPGSSRDCATSDNRRADGPVGYTVRWDACPPNVQQFDRTVEFVTPGVLLRRALAQPHQWFRHVTHLVLDEVHERSAEVDLLLSLAKQTLVRQQQQQQPPPLGADDDNDHRLQLVLMSATLDNDNNDNDDNQWQHYFAVCGPVTTVTIPSVRQFPIQTLHLGDSYFPILPSMQRLLELESMVTSSSDPNDEYNNNTSNSTITSSSSAYDDQLLDATAELAWWLVQGGNNKQPAKPQVNLDDGGSILCFLPGMDEIRRVQQQIRQWQSYHKNHHHVDICVLHSAISTQEQARVFETSPHPRIILSTNIAETR